MSWGHLSLRRLLDHECVFFHPPPDIWPDFCFYMIGKIWKLCTTYANACLWMRIFGMWLVLQELVSVIISPVWECFWWGKGVAELLNLQEGKWLSFKRSLTNDLVWSLSWLRKNRHQYKKKPAIIISQRMTSANECYRNSLLPLAPRLGTIEISHLFGQPMVMGRSLTPNLVLLCSKPLPNLLGCCWDTCICCCPSYPSLV